MNATLEIRCRDLGVDHDGIVSGSSLKDLVNCAEQQLRDEGIAPETTETVRMLRDTIRSAVLQTSRPTRFRSAGIARLIATLASPTPAVRSSSRKVTA